jgi:hypothetical protein
MRRRGSDNIAESTPKLKWQTIFTREAEKAILKPRLILPSIH